MRLIDILKLLTLGWLFNGGCAKVIVFLILSICLVMWLLDLF